MSGISEPDLSEPDLSERKLSERKLSERNPFVGPRPIQQGESLHGRSAEVRELFNRLQARRIVVLHSPSGAGKSSLVQAGLIPKLKEANFDVWKPIRVNLDPEGLEGVPATANRYLVSAMVSLEEELPAGRRRSPAELAGLDFGEYLDSRPRRKGREARSVVLLFDQFEEVLTVKPLAVEDKREFMSTIGRALNSDKYWALFIIREDYLAAFAPYRDRIPTQMANTIRLDLLGLEGARETAEQLAAAGGRAFPGVDKLIHDLSAVQVQQPDGSFATEQGHYVEPVQLQVVCRRLWDAMPDDDRSIDDEDIAKYAGVSTALAGYYADAVAKIAKPGSAAEPDPAVERGIREWVGSKLIVAGIRSQIRRGPVQSGGLDNLLIEQLASCYLLRTEQRAGADWFELSHDRLVEPVLRDNQRWEADHLHPFQVQARLWEDGKRSPDLLVGGKALMEAKLWTIANHALVTQSEDDFLDAAHKQQNLEIAKRVGLVLTAVAAIVVAGVMGWAWLDAKRLRDKAERATEEATQAREQAEQAEDEAHAAEAVAHKASLMAGASELLARNQVGAAAMVISTMDDAYQVRGWAQLVADILTRDTARSTLTHKRFVHSAAWSPDGKHVVTGSGDYTARVWRADGRGDPISFAGHGDEVVQARWSPDGKRIVTASKDMSARVWNADGSGQPIVLLGHSKALVDARWSPDGKQIATASDDKTARVWNADGSGTPVVLEGHGAEVRSCDWSPDGKRIVTASHDMTARVWNADGSGTPILLTGHTDKVVFAQWSPDGERIVTAAWDDTARIWSADGLGDSVELKGHDGLVMAVAWSSDGKQIASASADGSARIWNSDGTGESTPLAGHESWVVSVAWSASDRHLVTASKDGTARIWNVDGSGIPMILSGHRKDVVSAEWSPDGERVITASADRSARIWEVDSPDKPLVLEGHQGWVYWAAWSPDGTRIVTSAGGGRLNKDGSKDNTARVWNADGSGVPRILEGHQGWVYTAAWNPAGTRIVTASGDRSARIWADDGSGQFIELKGHEGQVRSATWSPDGTQIATASDDQSVRIWSAEGGEATKVLLGHAAAVRFAAWSPDGKRIASASMDRSARIWTADGSGTPIELEGHEDWVMSAAWSPDGEQVVTASADKTLRIWNPDGSGQPRMLEGHDDVVLSVAWSPDGKHIVSASEDHSARVWNAGGEGPAIRLSGHEDRVIAANWAPDGKHIVTASVDRTARIWELVRYLDLDDLRHDLFEITTECLSVDQRLDYLFETDEEAHAGYEACERSYERTPYFDAPPSADRGPH